MSVKNITLDDFRSELSTESKYIVELSYTKPELIFFTISVFHFTKLHNRLCFIESGD